MSAILLGVDGGDSSLDAVAFAGELVRATGAQVLVASAFPNEDHPIRDANPAFSHAREDAARQTVRRMSSELAGLGGERVETAVLVRASAAHGLDDLARDAQCALIVVGSSHVGARGRVLPGSTGERLLHGAPCAVAVVPRGYRNRVQGLRRIGVAFDGSREADAALTAAIDLAGATHAEMRIVRVVAKRREEVRRRADRDIEAACRRVPHAIMFETMAPTGDPAQVIAAQTADLDVLLAGSRGHGPLLAVILGGVTGRVLRTAACPVIAMPRGAVTPLRNLFAPAAMAPA